MIFTQVTFLFAFLPISIIIYLVAYRVSKKDLRVCNVVLVLLSLVFLWWAETKLLWMIIAMTAFLVIFRKTIEGASYNNKKSIMLFSVVSLIFIPVVLVYLPSMGLVSEEGEAISLQYFSGTLTAACVLFFTLGAISYVVDVYEGETEPGSILDVFTYTMLFPKVLCGPIVFWKDFKPQLGNREINLDGISIGIERIIIGLAKKVIIADTFYAQILLIDTKMAGVGLDVPTMWLRALLIGLRLYCDISGYADIAIGLCRIFGFDVGENFSYPFLSNSLTDFWRRWHISLGRWFREYVYVPLGGNRKGIMFVNIMITFTLAALWHGWRSTILLWGLVNGLLVMIEKLISSKIWYQKIPSAIKTALVIILTFLGWMLFMSSDIQTAEELFRNLFVSSAKWDPPNFTWEFFLTKRISVFIVITLIGALGGFRKLGEFIKNRTNEVIYLIVTRVIYLALLILSMMFVMGTSTVPFVYQAL